MDYRLDTHSKYPRRTREQVVSVLGLPASRWRLPLELTEQVLTESLDPLAVFNQLDSEHDSFLEHFESEWRALEKEYKRARTELISKRELVNKEFLESGQEVLGSKEIIKEWLKLIKTLQTGRYPNTTIVIEFDENLPYTFAKTLFDDFYRLVNTSGLGAVQRGELKVFISMSKEALSNNMGVIEDPLIQAALKSYGATVHQVHNFIG